MTATPDLAAIRARAEDYPNAYPLVLANDVQTLLARLEAAERELANLHLCMDYDGVPRRMEAANLAETYSGFKEQAVAEIDFDRASAWRDLQREIEAKTGEVDCPLILRVAYRIAGLMKEQVAIAAKLAGVVEGEREGVSTDCVWCGQGKGQHRESDGLCSVGGVTSQFYTVRKAAIPLAERVGLLVERVAEKDARIAELRKEADEQRDLADKRDWRFREEQGAWLATRSANERLTARIAELEAERDAMEVLVRTFRDPNYDGNFIEQQIAEVKGVA